MKLAGKLICLLVVLALGATAPVSAAAVCTAWVHLQGGGRDMNLYDERNRGDCVRDVERQIQQGGYRPSRSSDTLIIWFGDDVVTARCMSRTLVAFSSYELRSRDACPLLDRIKHILRLE